MLCNINLIHSCLCPIFALAYFWNINVGIVFHVSLKGSIVQNASLTNILALLMHESFLPLYVYPVPPALLSCSDSLSSYSPLWDHWQARPPRVFCPPAHFSPSDVCLLWILISSTLLLTVHYFSLNSLVWIEKTKQIWEVTHLWWKKGDIISNRFICSLKKQHVFIMLTS